MSVRTHGAPYPRGFTMIELLLVISIVGLMAALALPKVRLDNGQVDTAARTISMSLMAAQRESVARGHPVLVVFDTAAHTIRSVWDANGNEAADVGEHTKPVVLPERVMLGRPSDVAALGSATASVPVMKSSARGPYLIMQRNGALDRAVTIYLTTIMSMSGGPDREVRALVLSRATGRADVYIWTGTQWRRG